MPTTLEQALNVIEMLAAHIHTLVVTPVDAMTMDAKRSTEEMARCAVIFVRAVRREARPAEAEMTVEDVARIFNVPLHHLKNGANP